jgi:beta-N-acetylhexosaminidase
LDLRQAGAHDVIGDRAFGEDPMQVAAIGRAVLEGLAEGGVAGCIKHMPGHGRSMVDSHREMPTVRENAEELERDLAPFRALAGAARIGMTGHLLFPVWDAENPATLSSTIIEEVIRGSIGFDGLLLTDDIDMEALSDSIPQRSARAIAAGCDVVLNCWAKMDDMTGISEVLPTMNEAALARLDHALQETRVAEAMGSDHAELLAERDALLALSGETA